MNAYEALNRLAKWRTVLAGQWLGTKPIADGPTRALRDIQEARLILRADVNAISTLLVSKGVMTVEEYTAALAKEAELLNVTLELRFPGMRATGDGMDMSLPAAQETMEREGFPP